MTIAAADPAAAGIPPAPTAAPTAAPAGLAETALLRINPLPGRRLAAPELIKAVRVLAEAERECLALADAACAELFALAASAVGRERQQILELKRAVYNGREPVPAPERQWPASTSVWLQARQRSTLARSVLTTGYDACLTQERAALSEAVGSEPFQLSLALTSPQLLDAVRRYARSAGDPAKRDRKSERGILQQFFRAMVRTSPLARFTAVGFATWSQDGGPLDRAVFPRRRAHSFPTMDRALISTLVAGLLPTDSGPADSARPPATVARNPSLRIVGAAVRYHYHDGAQVKVISTPLIAPLRALLGLTALGAVPTDGLRRALAERFEITEPDAERIVHAAHAARILVPGPVLDEQLENPLPPAARLLRDSVPDAAADLTQVCTELDKLATATVPERIALLRRLETAQQRLNAAGSRPARLHVNEDFVLEPAEVSAAGYEAALGDLAPVTEFCSLFDRHHDRRALARTLFVDRFGPGASVPVADHAADLVSGVLAREARLTADTVDDFGPPDGSLTRLMALREKAVRAVAERIARQSAEDPQAEELVLATEFLAELTAATPERYRRPAASYGLLVQAHDGRLVLNGCYPGHGMLGARFLGADRDLGGRAAESIARRAAALFSGDGIEAREDHGLHGVNINHRIPVMDRTIGPDEWMRTRLTHDRSRDELVFLDQDGTPVRPVSLGMGWAELFPAPLRLAMWLSDTSRVPLEAFGWERAGTPAAAGRGRTAPRLVAGRVVLQRRRWYPGDDFPAAPGPAGPAQHLVDLTAWRAAHGVPEEVVVKSAYLEDAESHQAEISHYLANRRREKPQYADLASALSARVLPRLLDRRPSGSYYLEEALPGVGRGRHACEWVIELDRPAGARFQLGDS